MGVEGLKIVRYCSKYYLYYTRLDGNPEIVGSDIVELIPTENEHYQRWLDSTRKTYAEIARVLESHVVVSAEDLLDSPKKYDLAQEGFKHWMTVDDGLLQLPSHLAMVYDSPKLWPNWTYVIDLDRELFSLNFGVHFKLNQIPRAGVWMRACEQDEYGNITIANSVCPEGCIASPALVHGPMDMQPWEAHRVVFVTPTQAKLDPPRASHRQLILMLLFQSFSSRFKLHIQRFLLEWHPEDFIFREFAFAILSIASGQVGLESPARLDGGIEEGYLLKPHEEVSTPRSRLLPIFTLGCHWPGENPGSAPSSSMYWFEGVLINLAVKLDSPKMVEAAIARILRVASDEDRREYYALLLSIEHIVILQIRECDGIPTVKRIGPITLFNIESHLARDPRERPPQKRSVSHLHRRFLESNGSSKMFGSMESVFSFFPGFRLLIQFFDVAITQNLRPSPSLKEGCFPVEVYHMILDRIDDHHTYNSCAKVSRNFRSYCFQHFRLGREMVILDCNNKMEFTISDRNDDLNMTRNVSLVKEHQGLHHLYPIWSAIIGSHDRPSLLDSVGIAFHDLVVHVRKPTRKSREPFTLCRQPTGADIHDLHVLKYAPFRYLERLWAHYLRRVFAPPSHRFWTVEQSSYLCTLMPDYREVYIRYGEFGCWLALHRTLTCDDVTSGEIWEDTIWRVSQRLELYASSDTWVLIAFGTKTRISWWKRRDGWKCRDHGVTGGKLTVLATVDLSKQKSRDQFESLFRDLKNVWEKGRNFSPLGVEMGQG